MKHYLWTSSFHVNKPPVLFLSLGVMIVGLPFQTYTSTIFTCDLNMTSATANNVNKCTHLTLCTGQSTCVTQHHHLHLHCHQCSTTTTWPCLISQRLNRVRGKERRTGRRNRDSSSRRRNSMWKRTFHWLRIKMGSVELRRNVHRHRGFTVSSVLIAGMEETFERSSRFCVNYMWLEFSLIWNSALLLPTARNYVLTCFNALNPSQKF